ncbi:MAG: hypothetical protein LBN00_03965 [Oscillospiraceae bacterium]|jgi:hypothetical protein|nr:hypothetical protein [Oscillospiraceae bacterium]
MKKATFEIVKASIDKWDPYGFFPMGAPANEYDGESKLIALEIDSESDINDVAYIVSKVFTSQFGDPKLFCYENCVDVANEINSYLINNK